MTDDRESVLVLALRAFRFATDHPYAATGIFGAAVGSAITYTVLTSGPARSSVFTPKVYELTLTPEDLRRMQTDPTTEIRMQTGELVVVVVPEQREPLKALPDIIQ
jgi:hypothetical protein